MNGIRMILTPHAVVGFCFMFLGSALAADKLDLYPIERSIQLWPVVLILFGLSIVVQGGRWGNEGQSGPRKDTAAPIAALVWLLIVGTVLSLGFQRRKEINDSADQIRLVAVMGRDELMSGATPFRGGEMRSVMGSTVLDLRDATIQSGDEAVVDVFTLMGGIVVRVPDGWDVVLQVTPIMGGARDARWKTFDDDDDNADTATPPPARPAPTDGGPAPRLIVRGVALMGGVTIKS